MRALDSFREAEVMNTHKWLSHRRSFLLGAINGLFSCAILAIIERITIHYAELQEQIDMQSGPVGYILQRQPFWNVTNCLWHVILFIAASLLLHRYLSSRIKSVLLLWVCVGAAVITGWALTFLTVTILMEVSPLEKILKSMIYSSSQRSAFKFVAIVMSINVIYGTVVQMATKHYFREE